MRRIGFRGHEVSIFRGKAFCHKCALYHPLKDLKWVAYADCLGLDGQELEDTFVCMPMLGPVRVVTGTHRVTQPLVKKILQVNKEQFHIGVRILNEVSLSVSSRLLEFHKSAASLSAPSSPSAVDMAAPWMFQVSPLHDLRVVGGLLFCNKCGC